MLQALWSTSGTHLQYLCFNYYAYLPEPKISLVIGTMGSLAIALYFKAENTVQIICILYWIVMGL